MCNIHTCNTCATHTCNTHTHATHTHTHSHPHTCNIHVQHIHAHTYMYTHAPHTHTGVAHTHVHICTLTHVQHTHMQHIYLHTYNTYAHIHIYKCATHTHTLTCATHITRCYIHDCDWQCLCVVGLGALSAAVMSSMDSSILGSSTMFTHNIYNNIIRKQVNANHRKLTVSREIQFHSRVQCSHTTSTQQHHPNTGKRKSS